MKLALALFVLSVSLRAAPDVWTYWIQPCGQELAQSTHCESADVQLAAWALDAWADASGGKIVMKKAAGENDARLRMYWAGGNLQLYGETRPLEVHGERGAALFIVASAATGDKLYRDSIVYLTCLHETGHALGLPHNRNFEDIMYSFQYGGDIGEYFARFRRKLKVRDDIQRNSGLTAANGALIQ